MITYDTVHRGLSPREAEIIVLIASDKTVKECAVLLGCSPDTVSTHIRLIYAKLGVNTQAAMVGKAVWYRMVDLSGVYPSIDPGPRAPGYVEPVAAPAPDDDGPTNGGVAVYDPGDDE